MLTALSEGDDLAATTLTDISLEAIALELEKENPVNNPQWEKISRERARLKYLYEKTGDRLAVLKEEKARLEKCVAVKSCAKKMDINEFLAFWMEYSNTFKDQVGGYLSKNKKNKVVWRGKVMDSILPAIDLAAFYQFQFPLTDLIIDAVPGGLEINRSRSYNFYADPGSRRIGVLKKYGKNGQEIFEERAEALARILIEQNNPRPRFFRYMARRSAPSGSALWKIKEYYAEFMDEFVSSFNEKEKLYRNFQKEVKPEDVEELRSKSWMGWYHDNLKNFGILGKSARAQKIRTMVRTARAFFEPVGGPAMQLFFWTMNGMIWVNSLTCFKDHNCLLLQFLHSIYCKFHVDECVKEAETKEGAKALENAIQLGNEAEEGLRREADEMRRKLQGINKKEREEILEQLENYENPKEVARCLLSGSNSEDAYNCLP